MKTSETMWNKDQFEATVLFIWSLTSILFGKIMLAFDVHSLSLLGSIVGIVAGCFACVNYFVNIMKMLREMPPKSTRKEKIRHILKLKK